MKGGAIKTHEIFMSMSIRGNLDDTSWKKLFKNNCVEGKIIFCTREEVPCSSIQFNLVWRRSRRCTAKKRALVVWSSILIVTCVKYPPACSLQQETCDLGQIGWVLRGWAPSSSGKPRPRQAWSSGDSPMGWPSFHLHLDFDLLISLLPVKSKHLF